jgi:ATP-dependent DNA ligase
MLNRLGKLTKPPSTKRVPPAFIEPMCAQAVRELLDGAARSYEAKLDGYRCLTAKCSSGTLDFSYTISISAIDWTERPR